MSTSKKIRAKLGAVGIGILFLVGCADDRDLYAEFEGWKGRNAAPFVAAWGPPDEEVNYPDGRKTLQWAKLQTTVRPRGSSVRVLSVGGFSVPIVSPSLPSGQIEECTIRLTLAKNASVLGTGFEGRGCQAIDLPS